MSREILPTNVLFTNYNIELTPNFDKFDKFKYSGTEVILLSIIKPTETIILNSHELVIESALLKYNSNDLYSNISYDEETQQVTLKFPMIQSGNYKLYISFTGTHNDQMAGFYRSKYTNQTGQDKYMMVTQFEATDARRAFPCGDEPSLKATFDITLHVPKELIALSNMPIKYTTQHHTNSDLKTVQFEQTPIMSTYLLAFYVGEVDYIERIIQKPVSNQDLQVRVYTPKGKSHQGKFALDLACNVLKYFSEYFGVEYPLPKMDLIAIPDFSAGAMENWGLVTFRTKYLLYEEGITSIKVKTLIAYIICHELAHQWFGNLVTMEWWSDLWLNEGFATWVGWMATDHFFPEWKVWEMFIIDEHNGALELDRLESSHPITNSVTKATQVNEIFDTITYSKGACIIRMLVNYLGEDIFKLGLQSYLKKFQYRNAKTTDLWNSLSDASNINVNRMMTSWTDQMGYPLVKVKTNNNNIQLFQYKYCNPTSTHIWSIPLNIKCLTDTVRCVEMDDVVYSFNNNNEWFKLNSEQTGFYLTQYDKTTLSKLGNAIVNNELNRSIDRTEIIETLFSLASTGYESVCIPLTFINSYTNETEYIVWASLICGINNIKIVWFKNKQFNDYLNNLMEPMLIPILNKLGWDSIKTDSYQDIQLRLITISYLSHTTKVINEAKIRIDAYINGNTNILPSDIRGCVFKLMVKHDDKYFNTLLNYYDTIESNEIQTEIIMALGSTNNQVLLLQAFDFCYNSGKVRPQDAFSVSVAASLTPLGRITNWNYIMDNWFTICKLYGGGKFLFGRLIGNSIEGLFDQDILTNANNFIEIHKDDTIEIQNTLNQAFEKARRGIEWLKRDTENLNNLVNSTSMHSNL